MTTSLLLSSHTFSPVRRHVVMQTINIYKKGDNSKNKIDKSKKKKYENHQIRFEFRLSKKILFISFQNVPYRKNVTAAILGTILWPTTVHEYVSLFHLPGIV